MEKNNKQELLEYVNKLQSRIAYLDVCIKKQTEFVNVALGKELWFEYQNASNTLLRLVNERYSLFDEKRYITESIDKF